MSRNAKYVIIRFTSFPDFRSSFPPLLSMPELRELAAQRPNTAGAVEALLFLTSHLARWAAGRRPGRVNLRAAPPTAPSYIARLCVAVGYCVCSMKMVLFPRAIPDPLVTSPSVYNILLVLLQPGSSSPSQLSVLLL